jgi:hypothetical protein
MLRWNVEPLVYNHFIFLSSPTCHLERIGTLFNQAVVVLCLANWSL